ncbi:anaerobic dehydrogenase [Kaistella haifensis]|nr:anaerobic dehydrogenase [Kaistella haifensis]
MVNKITEVSDVKGLYLFDCPGCKCSHYINTNPANGAVWEFNFDMKRPTVSPSIFVNRGSLDKRMPQCHSFIKDGQIQFLNDCTHNLAGHTVEIPDLE